MAMEGEFAKYLEDVYSAPPVPARGADRRVRDPRRRRRLRRAAALVQAAAQAGLRSTSASARRAATSAAPGTGTAIPGIACDVESYSYLPLLEEMGYVPTMKFASGFEIFEYCQTMAEQVRLLRPLPVPHHGRADRVGRGRPAAGPCYTDRGDAMRARFVILANGILTTPEAGPHRRAWRRSRASRSTPRAGTTTSTCDGKRVGIIGTGATAVQAIPELAKVAGRALRLPAHAVDDRRARPAGDDAGGDRDVGERAGLGASPARPLRQDLRRAARRSRPTTTTSPARSPTSRSASSTSAS